MDIEGEVKIPLKRYHELYEIERKVKSEEDKLQKEILEIFKAFFISSDFARLDQAARSMRVVLKFKVGGDIRYLGISGDRVIDINNYFKTQ